MYLDLSTQYQKDLACILGKITHHIHPYIVQAIEEDNSKFKEEFNQFRHPKCSVEAFLYERSDCVFPGFRRPINKQKGSRWKNNICGEDGTVLNDNTFPRHIWAYLVENRAYAGGQSGMWTRSGLDKFELAHVFAHKTDERNFERKVFREVSDDVEPYGLFTSASNVVLIPKGFAKPTDHMSSIKICFYKRHFDLYGNNLIGLRDFKESMLPEWYSDVQWMEPVLPKDWRAKVANLLRYRNKYLRNKYA
ncbi:hypothetical protein [Thalassolituus sp.]|uniref:hypothetical protein n=1 Tax=Thalassolituus sp. TaxID=2030822 RepID=UPI0032D902F2